MHWLIALYYHSDARAPALMTFTIVFILLAITVGYGIAIFTQPRTAAFFGRLGVLAMFLYFVAVQVRQILVPNVVLGTGWYAAGGLVALSVATFGAVRMVDVWTRLRAALVATALIAATSVFGLVAMLAPHIELFAGSHGPQRPVVVLLFDEFSAGSAQPLAAALGRRQLNVESWEVPSIGRDTIDAIPGMFSGVPLPGARVCTSTAVCGNKRAVDFARVRVVRNDVDIVGIYHRYCAIKGLRHCVNVVLDPDRPTSISFLCALPLRRFIGAQLGCSRPVPERATISFQVMTRELFGAPFWSQGGLLYAHLSTPHPPSAGGEQRLADAYAANVERASSLALAVVDRLEQTHGDDFVLIVTSDHHLRSDYWCKSEPYVSHDCDLPESMRSAGVPFIIAARGAVGAHAVPRTNADLLPIVAELSLVPGR